MTAVAAVPTAVAPKAERVERIDCVDLLRGIVMIIMVLDHARDFLSAAHFPAEDLARTNVALFFTRWITHFCAPTFFLLAGMGTGIAANRGRPRSALARFLATRGLWLIVIELTVVRFGWTFNLDYARFTILQVIWALGGSMIVLAVLIYLPRWAIAAFVVTLIAGHNLLDGIGLSGEGLRLEFGPTLIGAPWRDWLWAILHVQQAPVAYPLIPWVAVMAAGYVLSPWLLLPSAQRRHRFLGLGLVLCALFVGLRFLNDYGDPQPWSVQPSSAFTLLSFLNTWKYPPSLLFLLMTLGPALTLLPILERVHGPLARFFVTIGRVPFFFYIAHIYAVHALALVLGLATGFSLSTMRQSFFMFPADYGVGLPAVYAASIAVVLFLYPLCRYFAALKARRGDWWLSYL